MASAQHGSQHAAAPAAGALPSARRFHARRPQAVRFWPEHPPHSMPCSVYYKCDFKGEKPDKVACEPGVLLRLLWLRPRVGHGCHIACFAFVLLQSGSRCGTVGELVSGASAEGLPCSLRRGGTAHGGIPAGQLYNPYKKGCYDWSDDLDCPFVCPKKGRFNTTECAP